MAVLKLACIALCLLLVDSAYVRALSPNDTLPAIQLAGLDGRAVEVGGEAPVIIIEFWATWCLQCRTTLPAVAALAEQYSEAVHVYAIAIDRDAEDAKGFLRAYLPEIPPSMTILHDPGGELLARFGAAGMPAVYAAEGGVVGFVEAGAKPDLLDRLRGFVETRVTGLAARRLP